MPPPLPSHPPTLTIPLQSLTLPLHSTPFHQLSFSYSHTHSLYSLSTSLSTLSTLSLLSLSLTHAHTHTHTHTLHTFLTSLVPSTHLIFLRPPSVKVNDTVTHQTFLRYISGNIPFDAFANLTNLVTFYAFGTNTFLSGSISTSIGFLTALNNLNLQGV